MARLLTGFQVGDRFDVLVDEGVDGPGAPQLLLQLVLGGAETLNQAGVAPGNPQIVFELLKAKLAIIAVGEMMVKSK